MRETATEQTAARDRFARWVFLGALGVMLADFAAFWCAWGGWVNEDTAVQWEQVRSGVYSDWHPFAHTFLMMRLPAWLWHDYRVCVLWQVALFACAAAYVAASLRAAGVRRGWAAAALALTVLHPQTLFFLMTPVKDTAFALAVWVAVAAALRLVAARARTRDWAVFGGALALAALFRHNGVFFALPALLLMLAVRGRAHARGALVALGVAAAVLGAKTALARAVALRPASGHPAQYRFLESCGLPLTMMGAVYVAHPEAVPDEARRILDSIQPPDVWQRAYVLGSFNMVKHAYRPSRTTGGPPAWLPGASFAEEHLAEIAFTSWGDFARAFARTVAVDPALALRAAVRCTEQVWNPFGFRRADFEWPLRKIGLKRHVAEGTAVLWAVSPLVFGVCALVTLGLAAASVRALARRDGARLALAVPPLAYNLGTMCFLSGLNQQRLFFSNVLIALPLALFWFAPRERDTGGERG